MFKKSRREARQQWDTENLKLDAASRLRGICYIASDDQEFHSVINKERRILETLMESAMPCKAQRNSERRRHWIILCQPPEGNLVQKHICGKHHAPKKTTNQIQFMVTKLMLTNLGDAVSTKAACKRTKTTLQTRGYNSLSLYNLVHLPIPIPKTMTIQEAKVAADKEWDKFKNWPAREESKVRNKKGVTVHFATLVELCHLTIQKTFSRRTKGASHKTAGTNASLKPMLMSTVDPETDQVYLGCTQRESVTNCDRKVRLTQDTCFIQY